MICKFCGMFCTEALRWLVAPSRQGAGSEKPMCKDCFNAYVKHLSEAEKVKLQ